MDRSSRSDFSFSITRIAVAQICQSVGYDAAQTSALDILSNVTALYLKAIAKSATDSANSCGRTHSNLFDIVIALEDLSSGQGFPGASSTTPPRNSITSSSLLKEIKKFVLCTDEIPFAQPLPRGNLSRLRRQSDEKRSHCLGHVPTWLPEMPMIERKEEEIEKGEEILRWNSDSGVHQTIVVAVGEVKVKEERRGKELELPVKRGKVRFEMGLKGKSREVLSRFGTGKRVLCHNFTSNGNGIEGNGRKKKMMMIPR